MQQVRMINYNISNNLNTKIILISDTHYYNKNDINKLNIVLEKVKSESPDYICIPGDIFDEAIVSDTDLFIKWLKELSKISKVIICLGNHDIVIRKSMSYFYNKNLIDKIKKIKNIYLLENNSYNENNICFTGLFLDSDYYYVNEESSNIFIKYYNNAIKVLNKKQYNILLVHSPIAITRDEVIKKLNCKPNLVLCGHMHGGLTPVCLQKLLKTRVLVSPNKHKILVKNSYGNFKVENVNFVITSGITKLSHASDMSKLDFMFKPEIVIINI